MFKWLLNKLLPELSREEKEWIDKMAELRNHGVRFESYGGGWRVEFDSPEAAHWYYSRFLGKWKGKIAGGE
jgi:hypothetical protein